MTLPTLYELAANNKLKFFKCKVLIEGKKVYLVKEYGYVDGKAQVAKRRIVGKNLGKSNETSDLEQAYKEARAVWKKKKDKGYSEQKKQLNNSDTIFPMLAHQYTSKQHKITWPAFVQPKLNGVRCLARTDLTFQSRGGKAFVLEHLIEDTKKLMEYGISIPDGELFSRHLTFQEIQSSVKKVNNNTPLVSFWIFDMVSEKDFEERSLLIKQAFKSLMEESPGKTSIVRGFPNPEASSLKDLYQVEYLRYGSLVYVPTIEIDTLEKVDTWHQAFVKEGFEGIMIRNKKGPYLKKHRSSNLLKAKFFQDEEFEIIGGKEAEGADEGTVVFECITKEGKSFQVRPCGSRKLRAEYFQNLQSLIGKQLTVQYQNLSDAGVPIFPVGISIRDYE